MIAITKKEAESILKTLKRATKNNPNMGGFTIYYDKNNRGDYGYIETFVYKGSNYLIFDTDGAHKDCKWYKTINTESVMNQIMEDSKK